MKTMKTMIMTAFAAMIALSSCSKTEEAPVENNELQTVKIGLSVPNSTRNTGPTGIVGLETFKAGHIIFARTSGIIEKHIGVDKPTGTGSLQVTSVDLGANNVVIPGVPGAATQCYIISNDAAAQIKSATGITGNLEGTNVSTLLAEVAKVNQLNAVTTLANVPYYGLGTVTVGSGSTPSLAPFTASVQVNINSLASRLQIGKISAQDYTDGLGVTTTITAFELEGIYVNGSYTEMPLNTTLAAAAKVDGLSDYTKYSKTAPGIFTGDASSLADEFSPVLTASGSPMTVEQPTASDYWVYNLFPGHLPNVLVKLSSVTYQIGSQAPVTITDQYLSLTSYLDSSSTPVSSFLANNFYTIENIQFDYTDLSPVPFTTNLDVQVKISMFSWVNNLITWGR